MRVLVTGSSGLIGTALLDALDDAVPLRRGPQWDPERGLLDPAVLEGVDAVVNLAGAGIGDHRWTDEYKKKMVDSRVNGTRALADAMGERVLVSGSAVGFYGDTGDTAVDERAAAGTGFLAELCKEWEAAASAARGRTVLVRTGIVLSPKGGALKKQLPIFKVGAGGKLGTGRQWLSWVSLDDEVGAIKFALENSNIEGPLNATAPNPATNEAFTKALARTLHRPAFMPVPGAALKLAFSREMAEEMLLAGQRVQPAKLEAAGYQFRHPELDAALEALL